MRDLEQLSVNGKRVILRLDLNVTINGVDQLTNDYRLRAVLPTLNYLINRQAKIIILAHLGRPEGRIVKNLTLRPIYLALSALIKRPIKFAPQLFSQSTKNAINDLAQGEIIGLENLRFDSGEDNNSRTFARKLANYGEIFINDAFADCHRQAASMVAITEFLPSYPGLLLEKEYLVLTGLLRHPARPFVGLIGGAKIADKLPVIQQLGQRVDRLLVGGGVANTFFVSQGVNMKQSLIEPQVIDQARQIYHRLGKKILLPVDFVWHDDQALDLGPKTIDQFRRIILQARTIFWAGPMGKVEERKFAIASNDLAHAICDSQATSIIGGGDTAEIITRLRLTNRISFVSTGGGASLSLLAGRTLPGIEALRS